MAVDLMLKRLSAKVMVGSVLGGLLDGFALMTCLALAFIYVALSSNYPGGPARRYALTAAGDSRSDTSLVRQH
jgi:hypothetical protein